MLYRGSENELPQVLTIQQVVLTLFQHFSLVMSEIESLHETLIEIEHNDSCFRFACKLLILLGDRHANGVMTGTPQGTSETRDFMTTSSRASHYDTIAFQGESRFSVGSIVASYEKLQREVLLARNEAAAAGTTLTQKAESELREFFASLYGMSLSPHLFALNESNVQVVAVAHFVSHSRNLQCAICTSSECHCAVLPNVNLDEIFHVPAVMHTLNWANSTAIELTLNHLLVSNVTVSALHHQYAGLIGTVSEGRFVASAARFRELVAE